jgi:hypothetical protein
MSLDQARKQRRARQRDPLGSGGNLDLLGGTGRDNPVSPDDHHPALPRGGGNAIPDGIGSQHHGRAAVAGGASLRRRRTSGSQHDGRGES